MSDETLSAPTTAQPASAPSGGELVVFGAKGRQLLFEEHELVLPARLQSSPRAAWYLKQFETIKPVWINWIRRGERGLEHKTLDEIAELMAATLEKRTQAKHASKKKHHQRKYAMAVDEHVRSIIAGEKTFGNDAKMVLLTNFIAPAAFVAMPQADRDALLADVLSGAKQVVAASRMGQTHASPAEVADAVQNITATPFQSPCITDYISAADWEARDAERKAKGAAGVDASTVAGDASNNNSDSDGNSDDGGAEGRAAKRKRKEHYRKHYKGSHEIDVTDGVVCLFVKLPTDADVAAVCAALHGRVYLGSAVVCKPMRLYVEKHHGAQQPEQQN